MTEISKKAFIEISVPDRAHLKMEINDLFDVYMSMAFLTTYFLEPQECAYVEEPKADTEG